MEILLVYANTYTLLWPGPVGVSYLARAAREAGHRVQVVDLMFEKDPEAVLDRALAARPWDLVGLSLRNLDNADPTNPRSFVEDHARRVGKAMGVAPTVIGGPAVTAAPEAMLRRTGATWAIAGQAERCFPTFLREVAAGATRFTAAGVLWREGELIKSNSPDLGGHTQGIDWSVIDTKRYKRRYMAYGLVTKSGCPHGCTFCDASITAGPCFVARDPESIVEDLRREAREWGLHRAEYMLIDPCFNQPPDWAKRFLEAVIRADLKWGWVGIVEPTKDLDEELCQLMVRAGNHMVTGLVGALHDAPLRAQRRPFGLDDVAHAFELFERTGVLYMPQFMFGGPGETDETIDTGLRFLARFKPIMFTTGLGVRVYPRAQIRAQAIAEGQIAADDDLLEPRFYYAPGLDQVRVRARLKQARPPFWPSMWGWARYMGRASRLWF